MYDSFAQLPGLQALAFAGVGSAQGSSLFALAGLSTGLVGAPSFGGASHDAQSVNVAAGLSGYLGTGQVGASTWNTGSYAVAATGPVQGNVASYQSNWAAASSSNARWHTVGGRPVRAQGGVAAYAWTDGRTSQAGVMLGYQTGRSQTANAQTSWSKVPHVNTEKEWKAASNVVASRLVGSTGGQQRIHLNGQNPWTNADGRRDERTAVWQVMQNDQSLRYDVDRGMFFRTYPDGSTRDVASLDNVQNVRRLAGGDSDLANRLVSQHVRGSMAESAIRPFPDLVGNGNGNGNGNGGGQPADPGQPGNPGNNPGVPPGNPGNNPPGSNPGNNPPGGGNPGVPPGGGNPGTGLPNPPSNPPSNPGWEFPGYPPSDGPPSSGIPNPYPGQPTTGIPGPYPGQPTTGIPGPYPNDPGVGIPGPYPSPPGVGIPGPYPAPPSVGIPGPYPNNYPAWLGQPGGYPNVPLAGIPGPYPFSFGFGSSWMC